MATRKKLSSWVRGTVYQNFDNAPDLVLPPGKVAGIVTPIDPGGWAAAKLKGFTHLYAQNGIPEDERQWTIKSDQLDKTTTCTQDEGVRPAPTPTDAYNSGYRIGGSYSKKSIPTNEWTDGEAICNGIYWQTEEQFVRGYTDRIGSTSAADNWYMGGYMAGQNAITPKKFNVNSGGYESNPLHPYFIDGLKSEANARKELNTDNKTYNNDFPFFSRGLHQKTNLLTLGYVGLDEPDERQFFLSTMYELFRKKLAGIDKSVIFCSPWSQAVNLESDVQYKNRGWIIRRPDVGPDDYFIVQDWHMTPTWALTPLSFFSLLFAEGWVHFDSMRFNQSKLITNMAPDGDLISNNRWRWYSGSGNPAPSLIPESSPVRFPTRPLSNMDPMIDVMSWFAAIWPIAQAAGGPMHLAYTSNGRQAPLKMGTLDAYVPTSAKKNYGQDTVLYLADTKMGLQVGAEIGSDYFIAHYNSYLSPLRTETVISTLPSGRKIDMGKLNGKQLHVQHS